VKQLQAAVEACPTLVGPRWHLAWVLAELGQFGRAAIEYQAILKTVPDFSDAYHGLASTLQKLSRHDEAVAAYREAIDRDPHNPELHYNLAASYLAVGQLQDALVAARRAVRLEPDDADFVGSMGAALAELRHWEEAVEFHRRALALKPGFDHAYNLGVSLYELGRFREAEEAFRTAQKFETTTTDIRLRLALAVRDQQRLAEALAILEEATDLQPTDGQVLSAMSDVQLCAGLVDEAVKTARKAIDSSPDLAPSHAALGWASIQKGSPAIALESFDRALSITSTDLDSEVGRAVALSLLERHAAAVTAFEKVLRRDPEYFARRADLAEHVERSRAAVRVRSHAE
jgi:superkiller protein 3